jgi:hypothetical protein
MTRVAGLAAVMVAVLCSGCAALGPSESELALQTQVAEQATQLAELQPSPTEVPSATPSLSPTATEPAPVPPVVSTGVGPCELIAEGEATVYNRPHLDATVFGSMTSGFRVQLQARTADGWWGFEPGVAQAANVGVFRLRWVHEGAPIRLEGLCGEVREVVGPPPGVCFDMPMEDVLVLADPDPSAEVVASLALGDYAAVVGRSDSWAMLDLSVGNTSQDIVGWVPVAALNMNGLCDSLPTVEP